MSDERLTGHEMTEMQDGIAAEELLAHPLLARALSDLRAYYIHKCAHDERDKVSQWRDLLDAASDLETTLRAYIATGQIAQKRHERFHKLKAAAQEVRRRVDRFTF